ADNDPGYDTPQLVPDSGGQQEDSQVAGLRQFRELRSIPRKGLRPFQAAQRARERSNRIVAMVPAGQALRGTNQIVDVERGCRPNLAPTCVAKASLSQALKCVAEKYPLGIR